MVPHSGAQTTNIDLVEPVELVEPVNLVEPVELVKSEDLVEPIDAGHLVKLVFFYRGSQNLFFQGFITQVWHQNPDISQNLFFRVLSPKCGTKIQISPFY